MEMQDLDYEVLYEPRKDESRSTGLFMKMIDDDYNPLECKVILTESW